MKIASLLPSVGITCVSGSSPTPNRRPAHAGNRGPQLRQPDGGRVAHPLANALAKRCDDARVRGLLGIAHAQVDHLEARRTPLLNRLSEQHERIGRLRSKDGRERHARDAR